MTFLDAIILGIVEGVTEFLPISSTGHLVLVSELLGIVQTNFHKSFEIAIQLGAICAVVFLYWRSFLEVEVLKRLAVAFLPTALIGFTLYRVVKDYLLGSSEVVLGALFLGGVALIAFELLHRERQDAADTIADISWKQAALVGLFQSIALIPGVSRSAATILGGLLVGLRRKTIVEFSFLLAVPTMLAATGYDLLRQGDTFASDEFGLIAVGFVAAFVVALGSITFLLQFVKNHTFISFGVYRIVLAALFFLYLW
jgi:undecaprenyl-diphosphatase